MLIKDNVCIMRSMNIPIHRDNTKLTALMEGSTVWISKNKFYLAFDICSYQKFYLLFMIF